MTIVKARTALLAAAVLGAAAFTSESASAMPAGGLEKAASQLSEPVQVRWACGPYRCRQRSGFYVYERADAFPPRTPDYGPRLYGPPWWQGYGPWGPWWWERPVYSYRGGWGW